MTSLRSAVYDAPRTAFDFAVYEGEGAVGAVDRNVHGAAFGSTARAVGDAVRLAVGDALEAAIDGELMEASL